MSELNSEQGGFTPPPLYSGSIRRAGQVAAVFTELMCLCPKDVTADKETEFATEALRSAVQIVLYDSNRIR